MAIYIKLKKEFNIQEKLKEIIMNDSSSRWVMDGENDLTLAYSDLLYHAWIRIKQTDKSSTDVYFVIVASTQYPMTTLLYAVYHSQLVELLLTYFDSHIENLKVFPLLQKDLDVFQTK